MSVNSNNNINSNNDWSFGLLTGLISDIRVGLLISVYQHETRDPDGRKIVKDKLQIRTRNSAGKCFLIEFECSNRHLYEPFEGKEIVFPVFQSSFLGDGKQGKQLIQYGKTLPDIPPVELEVLLSLFDSSVVTKTSSAAANNSVSSSSSGSDKRGLNPLS